MLKENQVSGQVLDHLGLVAGTINKTGLVDIIDKAIPVSEKHGAKVTMGERVSAMIMNGLGFIDDRLYMFPKFLHNKPINKLFDKKLSAEDFNDDTLGRCLDTIYEYGSTKLFSKIAFEIGTKFGLLGKTIRIDTTSLSVYGTYDRDEEKPESGDKRDNIVADDEFKLKHGYSKDGRPDLKQMILTLATTGKSAIPIWSSTHSGDTSDKNVLHECAKKIKDITDNIKNAPSFIFVGDSAMYEKCTKNTSQMLWLSRVPQVSKQSKQMLSTKYDEKTWQALDNGYSIHHDIVKYKDVKQRWLLVFSKQAYKREIQTLEKNIAKEHKNISNQMWHLGNKQFQCIADAQSATKPYKKLLKYHKIKFTFEKVEGYTEKGRPKKDAIKTVLYYKIQSEVTENEELIKKHKIYKGRFILATNQLDEKALSNSDMLKEYKEQIHTEKGFRFIKGDAFEVSSVFLKKESRIQALAMIMTLSLLIYNLAQHNLRTQLADNKDTVDSQVKNKKTENPTFSWICRMFHGIQVWQIDHGSKVQELVVNLTDDLCKIIKYFGPYTAKIYGISA